MKSHFSLLLLCLIPCLFALAPESSAQERRPVPINLQSDLPLRVLTRPMASMYSAPSGAVLTSNIPTFTPYYVYKRPSISERNRNQGWYEVGKNDKGGITGWMKSSDIFEWRQSMCLTYTHPENRHPVLMFETKQSLEQLLLLPAEQRGQEIVKLYSAIDGDRLPTDFPVISMEPRRAVDFSREFYLLPILDYATVTIDGRESRLLELAAVAAGGSEARRASDIRKDAAYRDEAAAPPTATLKDIGSTMKFDLVWVIDTTVSMGPFIASVQEVMKRASEEFAGQAGLNENLRFGLWAYRDCKEAMPELEYTTRNFTPELLNLADFQRIIGQVEETRADSVDFPEDVFSGLEDAISKSRWTPGAVRIVVLVGDAPGHPPGHKWNLSGHDEHSIRLLATEHHVTILAIHIQPGGQAARHSKTARRQFTVLAHNPGTDIPAYFGLTPDQMTRFSESAQSIVGSIAYIIKSAQSQNLADLLEKEPDSAAEKDRGGKGSSQGLRQALKAAAVRWIGSKSGARAPRDITAWTVDKDLINPARASLEVRLLVSKSQLDSLSVLLNDIIQAGMLGKVSDSGFFASLQAVSAMASRDPARLRESGTLAESGLVPSFLEGLPYQSRVMALSEDLWKSWSADEKDAFLNRLKANAASYRKIHDSSDVWIKLNQDADPGESVYPLPLELLP